MARRNRAKVEAKITYINAGERLTPISFQSNEEYAISKGASVHGADCTFRRLWIGVTDESYKKGIGGI